ncbi:UvrD-helicase domain-containing protein [Flavobacterium sp. F372]|uniref:UvrD-helicase domain-containing protein n=1 Tax=Flavobacterium bernardetii TaxID=2813823 RepID=A0ABR7J1R0_9FLAO|nr:UvrD-helicase domain-containing protein [Flavobacterium bernardetii]MBC5836005.1 UvrD-helicase domain-containing protein [Flavobacterium bernardetii]NHF71255.1 UvrD-helicase domain-containing protein [Flavobacterium bernardetii]
MTKELLTQWVFNQKETIDECIQQASYDYWLANKEEDNIVFDINECSNECYALSQNKDLCYDRPSIGFTYSLWYHGRRVNTFLKYFIEIIYEARNEEEITIYDLGAGTGAIQWACGLVYVGMKAINCKCPKLIIINIDTSPFMMDYNRSFLWPNFIKNYPEAINIEIEYTLNSWNNTQINRASNNWITASYLFDHSENVDNLKQDFLKLLESFQPQKILLLSSYNKRHFTTQLSQTLKENNYALKEIESDLLFSGTMTASLVARNWFRQNQSIEFLGTPTWNDNALFGAVLSSTAPLFNLFGREEATKIDLYNPPIKVRREIILNPQQESASVPDGRPTIITGPAGCGKSVVLTERIAKVVDIHVKTNQLDKLSVLVTTFNKQLSYYLQNWIIELLDAKKIKHTKHDEYGIQIEGSNFVNIMIYHFDVLPTRLWKIYSLVDYPFHDDTLQFDNYHRMIVRSAIEEIKLEDKITNNEFDNILNQDYILDEYHRIIYGLDYSSEEVYLNSPRKGRPRLPYDGPSRKLLFKTIIRYLEKLETSKHSSIFTRRHKFLKKLKTESFNNLFEYIFVDEFQDCTQSDYTIFYRLIKNPNNLILAGDYAQAVHIGKVSDIPRDTDETTERMRNRNYLRLDGSYRLPYRISEAIKRISENIKINGQEDTDVITPYKGAPPGARPILVFADNDVEMSNKIINIANSFKSFDIIDLESNPKRKITILEKDYNLTNSINRINIDIAETDTILRLKGMEKTCVLWSTKIKIDDEDEISNFIYTILTRTSGLLIIALYSEMETKYIDIINQLRKDRILIWDNQTKDFINNNYLKLN